MALTPKKVYAILKRQISDMEAKLNSPVRYKGTVASADLLPLNPSVGDMYNIESKSIYGEAGMNVAWNGVTWDPMGAPIDMSLYIKQDEIAEWARQQNKPAYTADEVGALPSDTKIPSKTSELQNDSGFLTKVPDSYLNGTDATLKESGKAADAGVTGKEINSLKEDKLDKPTEAPTVGKILRVKSVNEDGTFTCEWGDGGSNLDVQIDGESIVKDGVAEITVATKNATPGLFTASSYYGGMVYGDDPTGIGLCWMVSKASELDIDRRYIWATAHIPVCANGIDYAVKAAMCDGKGTAWTDTEKTGVWSRLNSIKTEMDDIAVAGAQYYLTEQTELTITLPDDALPGQETTVVWYNGDSAANLSIDGNILDFDYVPSANTRSELSCLWDGTYWCLICNEQSVPSEEAADE